jgi:TPR repeat protein
LLAHHRARQAQFELGLCYETGSGVRVDPAAAARLYAEAAAMDPQLAPQLHPRAGVSGSALQHARARMASGVFTPLEQDITH